MERIGRERVAVRDALLHLEHAMALLERHEYAPVLWDLNQAMTHILTAFLCADRSASLHG